MFFSYNYVANLIIICFVLFPLRCLSVLWSLLSEFRVLPYDNLACHNHYTHTWMWYTSAWGGYQWSWVATTLMYFQLLDTSTMVPATCAVFSHPCFLPFVTHSHSSSHALTATGNPNWTAHAVFPALPLPHHHDVNC